MKTKYAAPGGDQAEEFLAIGGSYGPSASLIPGLMSQFAACYPAVNLRLYAVERARIEDLLVKSKIDIAVTSYPVHHAALKSEPLRSEKLSAIVPADHPFAKLKEIRIGELSKIRLVVKTGKEILSPHDLCHRDLDNLNHSSHIPPFGGDC